MILAIYIFTVAAITLLIGYKLGRVTESHRWADNVEEARTECSRLRSIRHAAEDFILIRPGATEMEKARAYTNLLMLLDDGLPETASVEELERLVG